MCRSMVDIQSSTAEIRRGKKKKKKEEERRNRMKIYMVSLLHRATINKCKLMCSLEQVVGLQICWSFTANPRHVSNLSRSSNSSKDLSGEYKFRWSTKGENYTVRRLRYGVTVCSGIAWKYRPKDYVVDGLSSLRYKLVAVESRPLYTWLLVTLPPHSTHFNGTYRAPESLDNSSTYHISQRHLLVTLLVLCMIFAQLLSLWCLYGLHIPVVQQFDCASLTLGNTCKHRWRIDDILYAIRDILQTTGGPWTRV